MRLVLCSAFLVSSVGLELGCGPESSGRQGDSPGAADAAAPADAGGGTPAADAAPGEPDAAAAPASKVIFVTSTGHTGNLGGPAGADAICAARAAAADLPGTFKAWVSASGEAARDRLHHGDGPYLRTDGVQVADDWADLVDGSLDAPVSRDENGAAVEDDAWTGTLPSGASTTSCSGFTSSSAGNAGVCGSTTATGSSWTDNIVPPCYLELRLYCVEQ